MPGVLCTHRALGLSSALSLALSRQLAVRAHFGHAHGRHKVGAEQPALRVDRVAERADHPVHGVLRAIAVRPQLREALGHEVHQARRAEPGEGVGGVAKEEEAVGVESFAQGLWRGLGVHDLCPEAPAARDTPEPLHYCPHSFHRVVCVWGGPIRCPYEYS